MRNQTRDERCDARPVQAASFLPGRATGYRVVVFDAADGGGIVGDGVTLKSVCRSSASRSKLRQPAAASRRLSRSSWVRIESIALAFASVFGAVPNNPPTLD